MNFIYVITSESMLVKDEGGLKDFITCKIGKSSMPEGRVATLQTGHPEQYLMTYFCVPHKYERALHTKYAQYRVLNEWFSLPRNTFVKLTQYLTDKSSIGARKSRTFNINQNTAKALRLKYEMGGKDAYRWGA